MKALVPALMAAVLLGAAPSSAAVQPAPGVPDPRIRSVLYESAEVVEITAHLGYQLMIEFGDDEQIENVSIGDSLSWQITPNRAADLLFVKPLEKDAVTNMAVVTTKRRYNFQLSSRQASGPRDPRLIYGVRFDYPAPPQPQAPEPEPAAPAPAERNSAYSYSGQAELAPRAVFDDGQSTWFAFAEDGETPAIFARDQSGAESVVNFSLRDGHVVVDQIAPAFVLRRGKQSVVLHNDAWREPAPGPDAPKPRPQRRRLFKGAQP